MAYVYGHYTLDGRLFYIGKGTGKGWGKRDRNPYWHNVAKKHGLDVRILEEDLTEEQAFDKEKQLIEEVGLDNLTNLSSGGKGGSSGVIPSEESRKKLSQAGKEYYSNPENKEKTSQALKEYYSNPENLKKKIQAMNRPEVKEKRSQALKEYYSNPENREKLSQTMNRPENREKKSKAMKALPKVTCSHCSKTVNPGNFTRWHKGGRCLLRGG